MQLVSIKKRLNTNKNILKITKSLKVMSMTRLRKFKDMEKKLVNILSTLDDIYHQQIGKKPNNKFYKNSDSIKTIGVFFFTDIGFCGNLNRLTIESLNSYNNLAKCIIIGNKGKKIIGGEFLCKLHSKNVVNDLYETIMKIIDENNNNYEVVLHSLKIDYIRFEEKIKEEIFNGYMKYLIKKSVVEFQKQESKIRLEKLTGAIYNSEQLNEELSSLYNKTYQYKVTNELLEIIGGSNN